MRVAVSTHVPATPPPSPEPSSSHATGSTPAGCFGDAYEALVRAMQDTVRLAPETPWYANVPAWTHSRALAALWRDLQSVIRASAPLRISARELELAVCVLLAGAIRRRKELNTACAAMRAYAITMKACCMHSALVLLSKSCINQAAA